MSNISTIAGEIGTKLTFGMKNCMDWQKLENYVIYDYLCCCCEEEIPCPVYVEEYSDDCSPTTITCATVTVEAETTSCEIISIE